MAVVPGSAGLPAMTRHRGNPNWGKWHPGNWFPPVPTEFEVRARQLRLTPDVYVSSRELKSWCERNRNRCYIPEWLLRKWGMHVDLRFDDAA